MATVPQTLQSFLALIRWKTLSASLAPGIVAFGLAVADGASLASFPFLCCGPSVLFIQVGTNLLNDAFDHKTGVDGPNRTGPRRISSPEMARWCAAAGLLCFSVALIFSIPAICLRGRLLPALLALCCGAGYLYTGGPFPYGYYALGDVTVFFFFGILYTSMATFVLQGGRLFSLNRVVAGSQVGCMTTNLMVINNLRDIDSDRSARKHTVSNLLGYRKGRWELVLSVAVAYLLGLWWLWQGAMLACLVPMLTLPFSFRRLHEIFTTSPSKRYNLFLQRFSFLNLMFACFLSMGLLASRLFSEL